MTTDLERRLIAALSQEAETAMTLTNTPQELQRFRDSVSHRSRRGRIALAAASVVLVAGAALGIAELADNSNSSAPPGHEPQPTTAVQTHDVGAPTPLAASVHQTVLGGPMNTGDFAFGSLWATSGDASRGYLYRISADGAKVLARTAVDGISNAAPSPVRIGSRIVVSNGAGTRFNVFDQAGHKVGTLPVAAGGPAAGDASGGWLISDIDTVRRVDALGHSLGLSVRLPDKDLVSVAVGGGSLWVLDASGTLSRIDPGTGKVTGTAALGSTQSLQVVWTRGAAFVAGSEYDVTRVDGTSLRATAVLKGNRRWSYQILSVAQDGSLWTEPSKGSIAHLDDQTLEVITFTSAFANDREAGTFGAAITANRVFLTDGDAASLHSFPRS